MLNRLRTVFACLSSQRARAASGNTAKRATGRPQEVGAGQIDLASETSECEAAR